MVKWIRSRVALLALAACFGACTHERFDRVVAGADGRELARLSMVGEQKEGPAVLHLRDGALKQGRYAEGLKTGQWVEVSADGDTTSISFYSNGRAHGLWQRFANGRRIYLACYLNGVEQGSRISWHLNGAPASLVRFVDGKEEGIAHRWRLSDAENFGLHDTGPYVHGLAQGTWRRYYADGVLCVENDHVNGVMHGFSTLWARDGTLLRKVEYRNNEKVRTIVDRLK